MLIQLTLSFLRSLLFRRFSLGTEGEWLEKKYQTNPFLRASRAAAGRCAAAKANSSKDAYGREMCRLEITGIRR